MSQDWFRVLSRYVPAFAQAQIRYHQLCRQLTAELRDSHAAAAGAVISRKQGRATLATAT